jgi:hypothetical protein
MVELYYERSTWAADDPCDRWDTWDPDRLQREWILVDTGVSNDKGFYMVDTLAAHHGRYKVIFTAPDNALLPDGQSVVYTADGTYTWNLDVPNYRQELTLPTDAALAANQAMYTFGLKKGVEGWVPWDNEDPDVAILMGDLIINYVADVALTEVDCECDFYDEMYVFGTVYDSDLAGNPAYPDVKQDGIANVTVTLERAYLTADAVLGWPDDLHRSCTGVDEIDPQDLNLVWVPIDQRETSEQGMVDIKDDPLTPNVDETLKYKWGGNYVYDLGAWAGGCCQDISLDQDFYLFRVVINGVASGAVGNWGCFEEGEARVLRVQANYELPCFSEHFDTTHVGHFDSNPHWPR